MQKLPPRYFTASKKNFLIKLVSALGFGGMAGFCILSCDKPVKTEHDVENMQEDVNIQHDAVGDTKALEPMPPADVKPMPHVETEQFMALRYAALPMKPPAEPPAEVDP